jgi:hypothetical protein
MNVPDQLTKIIILVAYNGFVPVLEQMSIAMVTQVIADCFTLSETAA